MCATTRELGLKNLAAPSQSSELDDFSLVLGGPLFQLLRRSHLKGNTLELLHRRVLASVLLTWAPLLILSAVRTGIGSGAQVSFFQDIELHARFLVSLPILIGAELLVHSRIRAVVRRFVEYRLVLPNDLGRFRQAIESAMKIRDSKLVELGIIVAVYTLGLWISSSRISPAAPWRLTPAGSWYVFVSIPVFQFVLLRWYVRLFIWFRFLWQVNRIDLNLLPTHPDRCGGLSFVGKSS